MQKPNVVVLVPTEKERQTIINNFGKDEYESYNNPIISTVSEIKGMEYKFVVCFNLISNYTERWNEILSGDSKKKTRYRYYFNLFYVGITRSQQYLCVIENKDNDFYKIFGTGLDGDFEYNEYTDEIFLCINQLTSDSSDWLNMAINELNAGNYEKAKILLKNVPLEKRKDLDMKCDMHICIQNNEFFKAAKLAFVLNDKTILDRLKNEYNIPESIWILKKIIYEPESITKNIIGTDETISELIERVYGKDEFEYKIKLKKLIIQKLGEYIFYSNEKIEKKLEEINVKRNR